jgi:hypothetical protein
MTMLDGKKTYIMAAILSLGTFALVMGWLSKEQYEIILGLFGPLGLAALRAGVARGATEKGKESGPEPAAALPEPAAALPEPAESAVGCSPGGNS